MAKITIFVGSGPYTTERPYTALRFAYTAAIDDHEVKMFLFEDAILAAKKGQSPSNIYNVEEWIQRNLEEKVEVAACGVCMKGRGVKDDELVDGVQKGTMELALEWTLESDKQLFF
ncbi:MAG: DsrE/DsrF/TusD sulfur relay family protein [Promethearchaeota archaeon]